jgi:uncharacterized protein (TIGR03086 family)
VINLLDGGQGRLFGTSYPVPETYMTMTDLGPAADHLCALIEAVPDSDLGRPTPCTEYTVGDLLHHIAGVTVAFGGAAVKARGESSDMAPWGDASKLDLDWRTSVPRRVRALAEAWRDPEAWKGMTRVGGGDQPGEVTGIILLGELVVHGWDLARGTGLPSEADSATLVPLYDLVRETFGPGQDPAARGPAFGPAVPVASNAPLLDQTLGLLGRNPAWSPS